VTVLGYVVAHKFDEGICARPAVHCLDVEGGERFHIEYPIPFCGFAASEATKALSPSLFEKEKEEEIVDVVDPEESPAAPARRSGIYGYCTVVDEGVVAKGAQHGKKFKNLKCDVAECGAILKSVQGNTSGFLRHLEAKGKSCPAHKEAHKAVVDASPHANKFHGADGAVLVKWSFDELFAAHVACLYAVVHCKIPANFLLNPKLRVWIAALNPCAGVPAQQTLRKIGAAAKACVVERRIKVFTDMKRTFRNGSCVSVQFDLWEDNQGRSWGGVTCLYCVEDERGVLCLVSDVLWFGLFPYASHTKANIALWILSVLAESGLSPEMVSTVTPDGAGDVKGAVKSVSTLKDKLVTCYGHGLQRGWLYAAGMEGKPSQNPAMRNTLLLNGRVAQLHGQSKHFRRLLREVQVAAGVVVPLKLLRANATRWTGRFENLRRNNSLYPHIGVALVKLRQVRRDKSETDSIKFYRKDPLEDDETNEVPLKHMEQDVEDLEQSFEAEAVFDQSFQATKFLQNVHGVTVDQKMLVVARLMKSQLDSIVVVSKEAKSSRKKEARVQIERKAVLLGEGATNFREIFGAQIKERFFASDVIVPPALLIMLALSKQTQDPFSKMPFAWRVRGMLELAKAVRAAKLILGDDKAAAAPASAPGQKRKARRASLFGDSDDDDDAAAAGGPAPTDTADYDRWRAVARQVVNAHSDKEGVVNHFSLVSAVKSEHPVIYCIYKQYGSSSLVSSNTESFFSHATALQDDHKSMGASWMQTICFLRGQTNLPPADEVKTKYFAMYRGAADAEDEEDESSDSDGESVEVRGDDMDMDV
jgi:hypothetical protein